MRSSAPFNLRRAHEIPRSGQSQKQAMASNDDSRIYGADPARDEAAADLSATRLPILWRCVCSGALWHSGGLRKVAGSDRPFERFDSSRLGAFANRTAPFEAAESRARNDREIASDACRSELLAGRDQLRLGNWLEREQSMNGIAQRATCEVETFLKANAPRRND